MKRIWYLVRCVAWYVVISFGLWLILGAFELAWSVVSGDLPEVNLGEWFVGSLKTRIALALPVSAILIAFAGDIAASRHDPNSLGILENVKGLSPLVFWILTTAYTISAIYQIFLARPLSALGFRI